MKRITKSIGAFAISLFAITSLGMSADASSWRHVDMNGTVVVNGKTISLTDNKAGDKFVSTDFRYNNGNSDGTLTNKSGYGATVSRTLPTNITNDRICRSRTFPLPMECGRWRW